ncbi:hypothetical protein RB195_016813 [Necator americanus]|uniref:Uncharacterized protein n=1 Tax=Necator americanus TaxID=51031 RepID=A0ABR1C3C8_NECAM
MKALVGFDRIRTIDCAVTAKPPSNFTKKTMTRNGWSNIQIRSDRSFPVLKFSCHRSLIAELHRQSFSIHEPLQELKNRR